LAVNLFIDTNIYCNFAEGVPQTVDILADLGQQLYLPSIIIGELSYGFRNGSQRITNLQNLDKIIQLL
jgi:tRNA(fMet)-specific endonuclease VapC